MILEALGVVLLMVGGVIQAAVGVPIHERMITDVNAKLPPEERFARNWWSGPKFARLFSTYAQYYPSAPLLRRSRNHGFVQLGIAAAGFLLILIGGGTPVVTAVAVVGVLVVAASVFNWQYHRPSSWSDSR